MATPASKRYDVLPSATQNKPYPVYIFVDKDAGVILEADKESCLFYAVGYLRGLLESVEQERDIYKARASK